MPQYGGCSIFNFPGRGRGGWFNLWLKWGEGVVKNAGMKWYPLVRDKIVVDAGADVIELGIPFSDPSADGPVIQKAGDKALALGIGLTQVLAMVKTFRQTDQLTPVVLMGYANPIERYDQRYDQRHEVEAGSSAKSAFIRDAAAC